MGRIREIVLLHHSHFDHGYTHTQPVIREFQKDYIDQALELLDQTDDWDEESRPRWTCEVTRQPRIWKETSGDDEIARFQRQVAAGRLGAGALEVNGTPLMTTGSFLHQMQTLGEYRRWSGDPARVAFQHDVTGLPWAAADILIDSGVELLVMAINLHTSGDGPGRRPNFFRWQAPSGRELLVHNGLHYTMFDQITEVGTFDVARMQENFARFQESVLVPGGYPYDFIYLTTTQVPVMYDNGSPNLATARLVKAWNETGSDVRVRYVTPELLLERVAELDGRSLPVHAGDWSDFWNYGAGSTAHETMLSSLAKSRLRAAGFVGAGVHHDVRRARLTGKAWDHLTDYDEHTWGASMSVSRPYHPESVLQLGLKRAMAYDAFELSSYVLQSTLQTLAGNPPTFGKAEGFLVVNPTALPVERTALLPAGWSEQQVWGRNLMFASHFRELKLADRDPGQFDSLADAIAVSVDLPPYSWKRIPFERARRVDLSPQLIERNEELEVLQFALDNPQDRTGAENTRRVGKRAIESPYHLLEYTAGDGRIVRLYDKRNRRELLARGSAYDFFELVREEPDPRFNRKRKAYYDRDTDKERNLIACWDSGWARRRHGVESLDSLTVERTPQAIRLKRRYSVRGLRSFEHEIRLYADRPWVEVNVELHLEDTVDPESYYLVSTLGLDAGWRARYDAGGVEQEWVREQLPGSSKNWITSETHVSMLDDSYCITVCNAEAPLAMPGDIRFDKPEEEFDRPANPLFVAWPANNYWETNFAASQPGRLRLRYGVFGSPADEAARVPLVAEQFTHEVEVTVLADCPREETTTLARIDDQSVRLLGADRPRPGLVRLILFNSAETSTSATIASPLLERASASRLAPTGERLEDLGPADGTLAVTIASRSSLLVGIESPS